MWPISSSFSRNGGYAPTYASIYAYGFIYYFIQQRSIKDHKNNPKQLHNTYTPMSENHANRTMCPENGKPLKN
jgi:hypothetical protein